MDNEQRLQQAQAYWDGEASAFDAAPDHGLRDPVVRGAWTARLQEWLPPSPATVLDIGCGTGSLSIVLASLGYDVTGVDLSPAMIAQAEAKAQATARSVTFRVMEAAAPQFPLQRFDVVVARHLLWMLPEPGRVLRRWTDLLTPSGRLVLIEGYWHTGAGLHSEQVVAALPASLTGVAVHDLSGQPELWGGAITDERYAVAAMLPART